MSKMSKEDAGCAFIMGLGLVLFAASFFIGAVNAIIAFAGILGLIMIASAIAN
jgi:hypothetical protein